jgi:seryl-tRNA synthetase
LTNEQLQKVVDAENKRRNDESEAKALRLLGQVRALTQSIDNLTKQRAEVQKEIVALPFDAMTVEDAVNGFAPKA